MAAKSLGVGILCLAHGKLAATLGSLRVSVASSVAWGGTIQSSLGLF